MALESDYASEHLVRIVTYLIFIYRQIAVLLINLPKIQQHEWIDLIFGCKQNGTEAANANNLFSPESYVDSSSKRNNTMSAYTTGRTITSIQYNCY